MTQDQRARIVEQKFLRDATKGQERALDPKQPGLLAFVPEGPDVHPARIAECRHEDENPLHPAADLDPPRAKGDLKLDDPAASQTAPSPSLLPPAPAATAPLHVPPSAGSP